MQYVIDAYRPRQNFIWRQFDGEASTLSVNYKPLTTKLGTTVSSAAWTVESGDAVISGAAVADNIASALITTADSGSSLIKVLATMADGQKQAAYIHITAVDPEGDGESW